MQLKLSFLRCVCNPLQRLCVSSARSAGEIAFLGERGQPFAEIVRVQGVWVSSRLRGKQTWVGALRGMLCAGLLRNFECA